MDGPQHKENSVAKSSIKAASETGLEPLRFGGALGDLVQSVRNRIAELSLAATLPLAAAGMTSIATAHEREERGVPVKVAPVNPGQPPTVQTLSEDEAAAIAAHFTNSNRSEGAVTAFLDDYHEAHQPTHSQRDGYAWARTLSGKEALSLLQKISEDKGDRFSKRATTLLAELDAMLASPVFQQGVAVIKDTNPDCKTPLGEMSNIWNRPEADIEQFLHVLKSPGFKEYQNSVSAATGVDLQTKLPTVVWQYSDYSTDPSEAIGPGLKSAVQQFRANIPDLPLRDIADLRPIFMNSRPEDDKESEIQTQAKFEAWMEKVHSGFDILKNQYSVTVDSLAELCDFLITPDQLYYLQREDVKELSRYLVATYPSLEVGRSWPPKFLIHNDGFLAGFARPILEQLQTDGPTMRHFLALFGKDLGEVRLAGLSPRIVQEIPMPLEQLIGNRAFSEFLDQQFQKYPSLQATLTAEQICKLTAAFAHREAYESLNSELSKRAALEQPDLSLKFSALKHELLQTLDQVGFDAITVSKVDDQSWGIHKLDESIAALRSPKARQLYDALHNQWGLERFDISDFCYALTDAEQKHEFLLHPENSRTFAAIRKLYPAPPLSTQSADSPTALLTNGPDVIVQAPILLCEDLARYLHRYDDTTVRVGPKGERYTDLSDLVRISRGASAIISHPAKFEAAGSLLEERFRMEACDAGEVLRSTKNIDRLLERLQSPQVAGLFEQLDGAFLDSVGAAGARESFRESLTSIKRFELATRLAEAEDIESTIRRAQAAEGSITSADSLGYLIQECYDNQAVQEALRDQNFVKFVRELDQRFFGGTVQLSRLREYEELYSELRDEPGALEALFSEEFRQLTSFLGQQFQVATEQASTLRPCLRVCKGLDLPTFGILVEQLRQQGEAISSNDIVLLSEISKDPNLRDRLANRQTLLDGLTVIYQRTAFPRRHLDKLSEIADPAKASDETLKQKLIEERKAISDAYTERPPLGELSNMQLLRLTMIDEMLRREDVQKHLGALIAKDIGTKTTELGGAIVLQGGRAALREHQPSSLSNRSFSSYKYDKLIDGLGTFHLHALEIDNSEYTGPSGWLGMPLVDIGYVDQFNLTDTVFTAMGHPTDENGQPVTSSVRVNADVYFIDKRDPRKPILRIIDLGEMVVPYMP